ncbi:MAG: hypothetical protein HY744_27415 [Deltaproteobacteria bacterium]|nr:hypothetical protein [Deltaproteobacteria bacterium]
MCCSPRSGPRRPVLLLGAAAVLAVRLAGAEPSSGAPPVAPATAAIPDPPGGLPRPAAAALAFVPGLLVGGSGHFALGLRPTAYRLFALQGVGTGLILAGVVPLVASGAAREAAGPLALTAISGVAVASTGWLGDVFGTAVPPAARGAPERRAPPIEAELGYRYMRQAAFPYRSFAVNGFDLRHGGLRLQPSAWFALGDRNSRLRGLAAYRYFGPRAPPAAPARDGSFLDLQLALTRHRLGSEGVEVLTGEVFADGRLDLARYDAELRGAFSQLGFGLGLQRFAVDDPAPGLGSGYAVLPLARCGFGVYLGRAAAPRGELMLYYNHRHDDYAGGMTSPLVGLPGHGGLDGRLYLTEELGVRLELAAGAAWVAGASLLVRSEVEP